MSEFRETLNKKAVALTYDEDKQNAPVIVASGMGYMAEKIVEIASENGVPVYEDDSLATVLTQLELGSEIPEELYQAVVDIYAYFLHFTLNGEEKKTEAAKPEVVSQEEEMQEESGSGMHCHILLPIIKAARKKPSRR